MYLFSLFNMCLIIWLQIVIFKLISNKRKWSDQEDIDDATHAGVHELANLDVTLSSAFGVADSITGFETIGVQLTNRNVMLSTVNFLSSNMKLRFISTAVKSFDINVVGTTLILNNKILELLDWVGSDEEGLHFWLILI